uniref:Uncharacterized protein n=1 Tax=Pithovirus LCPAC404 TaxID=2506597 RepID=A0A481ZG38_9VIRU|nr:MAG: uncharacterized protein LCPAC404_00750 [Pithovirus LCPAC404]
MSSGKICETIKRNGLRCNFKAKPGTTKCGIHSRKICKALFPSGTKCTQIASNIDGFCPKHRQNPDDYIEPKICEAVTTKNKSCRKKVKKGFTKCSFHVGHLCIAKNKNGSKCGKTVSKSSDICWYHRKQTEDNNEQPTCGKLIRRDKYCARPVKKEGLRCELHPDNRTICRKSGCKNAVSEGDIYCNFHINNPGNFLRCGEITKSTKKPCLAIVNIEGEKCIHHSENTKICVGVTQQGKKCDNITLKNQLFCCFHKIKTEQEKTQELERTLITKRRCEICDIEKPISEFDPCKKLPSKHNTICVPCVERDEVSETDKDDMRMMVCTKCGIEKRLGHYYNDIRGKYGKNASCKRCHKKHNFENARRVIKPGTKECPECKNYKEFQEFGTSLSNNSVDEDGYKIICKICTKNDTAMLKAKGMKRCSRCRQPTLFDQFDKEIYWCYQCRQNRRNTYGSTLNGYITKVYCTIKDSKNYRKETDITKRDLFDIYHKQNHKCGLCNILLTHNSAPEWDEHKFQIESHAHNLSPDRIDSLGSYSYQNVMIVCTRCNRSKWLSTKQDYLNNCLAIVDNFDGKNNDDEQKDFDDIYLESLRNNPQLISIIHSCYIRMTQSKWYNCDTTSILEDDIMDMYIKQRGRCKLSNHMMTFVVDCESANTRKAVQLIRINNISIDRINSEKCYALNNMQLVKRCLNIGKSTLKQEDFIKQCRRTVQHNFPEYFTNPETIL